MKAIPPAAHPARSAGFSRIELLAAALPLTLLGVLTLPLVGNTHIHSRLATCVDNHRRLAIAWQMYAAENAGWLPPNMDDGNTIPGRAWVPGQSGPGGGQEFDRRLIVDPAYSLLANYLQRDGSVFRCPADERFGREQGATEPQPIGRTVPPTRSVAMNGAVGTNPSVKSGKQPGDGPWLDNQHAHTYGRTWLTYGRETQFTRPGPAMTALILDEDSKSINDAYFGFGMQAAEWIDWPATWHDGAGTLSFADAHVEAHRWVDPRTPVGTSVARRNVPGSVDYAWLRDRISARISN